jgi:hypothetical protein
MTAFVITDSGGVAVECWEVDALLPSSDDSSSVRQMGVGEGGITGVDIITWPSPTTIYYPPSMEQGVHSNALDFTLFPSYVIPSFYADLFNSAPRCDFILT